MVGLYTYACLTSEGELFIVGKFKHGSGESHAASSQHYICGRVLCDKIIFSCERAALYLGGVSLPHIRGRVVYCGRVQTWPLTDWPFTGHSLTGHLLSIDWPFTYLLRRRSLLLCHRRSLNSNPATPSTAESTVAEPLRAVESSSAHD